MNDEVELLIDEEGTKFYVLKNSSLDLSDKNIEKVLNGLKRVNNNFYYKNKLIHRENGPAVEYTSGSKKWYKNGKLDRENDPAVEKSNGDKFWYKNGIKHREDGPAIEWSDGIKEWHLNGKELSEVEYKKYLIKKEYNNFKSEINNNIIDNKKIKI